MAINISELYDAAEKRRLEALQTAQKENSRQLEETLSGIQRQYRSDVTDAQTSARISALGLEDFFLSFFQIHLLLLKSLF